MTVALRIKVRLALRGAPTQRTIALPTNRLLLTEQPIHSIAMPARTTLGSSIKNGLRRSGRLRLPTPLAAPSSSPGPSRSGTSPSSSPAREGNESDTSGEKRKRSDTDDEDDGEAGRPQEKREDEARNPEEDRNDQQAVKQDEEERDISEVEQEEKLEDEDRERVKEGAIEPTVPKEEDNEEVLPKEEDDHENGHIQKRKRDSDDSDNGSPPRKKGASTSSSPSTDRNYRSPGAPSPRTPPPAHRALRRSSLEILQPPPGPGARPRGTPRRTYQLDSVTGREMVPLNERPPRPPTPIPAPGTVVAHAEGWHGFAPPPPPRQRNNHFLVEDHPRIPPQE